MEDKKKCSNTLFLAVLFLLLLPHFLNQLFTHVKIKKDRSSGAASELKRHMNIRSPYRNPFFGLISFDLMIAYMILLRKAHKTGNLLGYIYLLF